MTVRSSLGTGWNITWNAVGRLLALITWSIGIMTWVAVIMGVTLYGNEILIKDQCLTTGKMKTINTDYTIECTVTPTNNQEETE